MASPIRVFLICMFFLLFTHSIQADETISLKLGYMQLSPSGKVAAEVDGLGTRVDLEDDLGLDKSQNITAEAALSLGDWKFSVGYLPLGFEGNSLLSRSIYYDGKVYPAGSRVQSSLDVDIIDTGITWYLVNVDDLPTRVQLGLELAVKFTDAQSGITGADGITESVSETLPLPTLGVRARVAWSDFLGVSGRLGYLEYSDNHFLDADIQVEFSPIPMVGVFAGYRYLDLAIDESSFYLDSEFSGFYGGALVRF